MYEVFLFDCSPYGISLPNFCRSFVPAILRQKDYLVNVYVLSSLFFFES